jgi:hypothetical protein
VDLLAAYSNRPELLDDLTTAQGRLSAHAGRTDHVRRSVASDIGRPPQQRRVTDRLTAQEQDDLIHSYEAGTTARELAERYGLSRSTASGPRDTAEGSRSSSVAGKMWPKLR